MISGDSGTGTPSRCLLNVTVQPNYGKATVCSKGSVFTMIFTWMASKQCFRVFCCLHCSSPSRHLSESLCQLLGRLGRTWFPHLSNLGKGMGCSSRTPNLSPQWCQLKWIMRPFQVKDNPEHPGKGQGHWDMPFGKLNPKTCGMCSV